METALTRLHKTVIFLTVSIMFIIFKYAIPLLEDLYINVAVVYVIGMLTTAGTYSTIFVVVKFIMLRMKFVKKVLLGPAFLHGTWVGSFKDKHGNTIYTVEKYEQSFNSIQLSGIAYTKDEKVYAQWTSDAVNINTHKGEISYHYSCDVLTSNTRQQGVAVFTLDRAGMCAAPTHMIGYSADLIDGSRSANYECKIKGDKLYEFKEALHKAKKLLDV